MHYLFGFSGRINRAKLWLFILVTLAWEIVIGLVAVFGFNWSEFSERATAWSNASGVMIADEVIRFPHPNPVAGPLGWAALAIIAALLVAYFIALVAVYTKRLHDRNKGAIWLVPFLLIPWGLGILRIVALPELLDAGSFMGPLGVGFGTAHLIGTILGLWAFVELFCLSGTPGPNRFGPDPLAK